MSRPNGRYQFHPGGTTRDRLFSASGWPNRRPERSLNARYTTTVSAAPDATAADASCTVAHAPPPPPRVRAVKRSSGIPAQRITASSSFTSIAKVTAPSMSAGASPASAIAAAIASPASCSSLRPEFLENSVWPMPTIAVVARDGAPPAAG